MRLTTLLALAACQPSETNIRNRIPEASVAPGELDFGEVGPPLSSVLPVYVTNSGGADLDVTAVLEAPDVFAMQETAFVVPPGEQHDLAVMFTPTTFRAWDGRIVLETNDAENARIVVPVLGEGVDLPFPDISIENPGQTIEIPVNLNERDSDSRSFSIVNRGDADLDLGTLVLDGPGVFSITFDPSGYVVAPDGFVSAIVEYAPTQPDGDNATITIPSNDPDEPEVQVLVLGNGGGNFDFPIAAFDCPTEVLLTGPVWQHFDGTQSSDPNGYEPLTYQWIVSQRPEASDADVPLDPDDTAEIDLYVDVAGTWEVQLQVTNALGTRSVPAICTFEALPEDDLHVELSWDTPSADLDLHLVQGGAVFFEEPGDCNWCNKTPDWGVQNEDDDDPRLDIDDRGGYGPENINILVPETGTYEVKVHYFEDHGDGPVAATVRVWLDGVQVYEGAQVLQYNEVWDAGTADWPSALFVPVGSVWDAGNDRVCQ